MVIITGTFGERNHWNLTYPIKEEDLPRKIPNALKKSVSFKTMQIVTGSTVSKWAYVATDYSEFIIIIDYTSGNFIKLDIERYFVELPNKGHIIGTSY